MITSIKRKYKVLTNNPLVAEKLADTDLEVDCLALSFEGLLEAVRDEVHLGSHLLTHPLSGSVKPGETPYKSVLLAIRRGKTDIQSLRLIENALLTCRKFPLREGKMDPAVDRDFQVIDWTLFSSGLQALDGSYQADEID